MLISQSANNFTRDCIAYLCIRNPLNEIIYNFEEALIYKVQLPNIWTDVPGNIRENNYQL